MIVLNSGSSSDTTDIAHCLQSILPDPWLVFGVDTLTKATPFQGVSCRSLACFATPRWRLAAFSPGHVGPTATRAGTAMRAGCGLASQRLHLYEGI